MNLAQQLRAAGVPVFPCRFTLNAARGKYDKQPVVPKGVHWAEAARTQHPGDLAAFGIPVPPGVVIIDLDTYKEGCGTDSADALFGTRLPWGAALIQHTISGGSHYAFRLPEGWKVKQGDNFGAKGSGIDTRVAGLGFICSGVAPDGAGYAPAGTMGVFALTNPAALPVLPDECRGVLEDVAPAHQPTPLPEGNRDVETIRQALVKIPPNVGRTEWRDIGLALRHQFHDDEQTGLTLFDQWSSGQFTPTREAPENYAGWDDSEHQFMSFKVEGGIRIGTLYHKAVAYGWQMPAAIDVAAAFGPGAAAADVFGELMERVGTEGGNPKQTADLIAAVTGLSCDPMQRSILLAGLQFQLKEAGLLTAPVRKQLDKLAAPAAQKPQPQKPAPGQFVPIDTPLHSDSWARFHTKGNENKPKGTRENFDILTAAYGINIRYNEIGKQVEISGPGICQTGDLVDNAAISFIESQAELNEFPISRVDGCVVSKANATHYNPVSDWVQSAPWDNQDHVGHLFSQMQLAPEEDINAASALFRKWFRGAVAVGTGIANKMEYVLTLVDPKGGKGKTRFFNTFCPPELQYEGLTLDPANKDSLKQAVSYWLIELGELDATFSRADQARLKAHLSNSKDELRLPYAKRSDKYPRRTAYFGSVNKPEFLVDESGNRRFWPIRVDEVNYTHNVNMQQVWAQALAEVRAGEIWHLTPDENAAVSTRNDDFRAPCAVDDLLSVTFDPHQTVTSHQTVTQCLKAAGMHHPNKADTNAGAAWLRRQGFKKTKNRGVLGYWVPTPVTPAAAAMTSHLELVK